jgi:hypothetical protein
MANASVSGERFDDPNGTGGSANKNIFCSQFSKSSDMFLGNSLHFTALVSSVCARPKERVVSPPYYRFQNCLTAHASP